MIHFFSFTTIGPLLSQLWIESLPKNILEWFFLVILFLFTFSPFFLVYFKKIKFTKWFHILFFQMSFATLVLLDFYFIKIVKDFLFQKNTVDSISMSFDMYYTFVHFLIYTIIFFPMTFFYSMKNLFKKFTLKTFILTSVLSLWFFTCVYLFTSSVLIVLALMYSFGS